MLLLYPCTIVIHWLYENKDIYIAKTRLVSESLFVKMFFLTLCTYS